MRIIGGIHKGKNIFQPIDKTTRPLRDLVKESIFNLINHSNTINVEIKESNILDLFAGSGSFGLECISRGSNNVTFVESNYNAIVILKKNINKLKLKNKIQIIQKDCFKYLDNEIRDINKFDIIFIDPPYKEKKINDIIIKIKEKNILKENGVIIIHRHKKDSLNISDKFSLIDIRIYGISKILIGY